MSEQMPTGRTTSLELAAVTTSQEITYHHERDERRQLIAFVAAHTLPLLTPEQEISLANDIKVGRIAQQTLDAPEVIPEPDYEEKIGLIARGKQAKLHFMHANFRLVADIALKYYGSGLPLARKYGLMDMFNVGIIGLSRAVDKYNPYHINASNSDTTLRFSTMAVPWIKNEIVYNVREKGGTIRVPAETQHMLRKIHNLRGVGLTNQEVQAILELSDEEMRDCDDFAQLRDEVTSLDADRTQDDGELTLHGAIADPRAEADLQSIGQPQELEPVLAVDFSGPTDTVLGLLREHVNKLEFSESAIAVLELLRKYVNKEDNTLLDKIAAGEALFERERKRERAMSIIFEHPAVRPQLEALRPADVPHVSDWRDEAACKQEAELYAHSKRYKPETLEQIQKICGSCAVRQACGAFFLEHQPQRGRWIDGRTAAEFDPRRNKPKERSLSR